MISGNGICLKIYRLLEEIGLLSLIMGHVLDLVIQNLSLTLRIEMTVRLFVFMITSNLENKYNGTGTVTNYIFRFNH